MRRPLALLVIMLLLALSGSALASYHEAHYGWKVTAPADGATVVGPDVTLTVDPGMFQVAPPGGPNMDGQGHWHFFVDGEEVGKGPVNTFTFKGLSAGRHVLRVEAHHNDHTPYTGDEAAREVTVNVVLPVPGPYNWRIVEPADGAAVAGPDVTLTVDPGTFQVVPPGAVVVAGQGHWHFFVDGEEVGKGPVNSFTFKGLSAGQHVLRVEAHHNDHSLYSGDDAAREVTITVAPPAAAGSTAAQPLTWSIASPAAGANVSGSDVTLTINPGTVQVVPPGGPNVEGQGHWHFFVDGEEVGKGPSNSFTYKGLTPGKHTLRVELHHNDHSPYAGDAMAREVTVNVPLPKTGDNLLLYAAAGLALLAMGGALVWRWKTAEVK